MTEEEFWMMQALNRRRSRKELKAAGYIAVPCVCGHEKCHGWQLRLPGVDWDETMEVPITAEMMGY